LGGALGVDGFSVYFTVLIGFSVILTALFADDYLRREGLDGPELYVLLMLAASGGMVMAGANDLIVLFLGLEILSISVYVLAAMHLRRSESQEAAIKYFVLGAFSSAFFLYGIALVYGSTGSTNLVTIADFLATTALADDIILLAGLALLLVGFGFKVAAAPFHMWTPDVYQGAPTPTVSFMASAVKAAGFAALLRVFFLAFNSYATDWQPIVYALAVLSLLVGSVLAVVQTDVKRMLAYSSISHAGFVLVAVQAATDKGVEAALFYLGAYTFMVAGAFGVMTLVGRTGDAHHGLDDYRGLARQRPVLAFSFTVLLLSQAGVPFTSGFFAKFYVIDAAVEARSFWLAITAMIAAVVAAFLYLRIIVAMYLADEDESVELEPVEIPFRAGLGLAITVAVTLLFGFLPQPLVDFVGDAVPTLVAFS
jgi:NADH-quinone oxidoreductase subunit N